MTTQRNKACPHCRRSMRPDAFGDTGRFFCPFCHAEVSANGALLAPPTEGPRSLEDVAWEIYESGPGATPADDPDYRP